MHFSEFPNSAKTSKPRAWLASFGSREIALANCNPRVCEGGTDYVIKNDRVQEALPVRARVVTNSTDFGGAGECKPGAWLAGRTLRRILLEVSPQAPCVRGWHEFRKNLRNPLEVIPVCVWVAQVGSAEIGGTK